MTKPNEDSSITSKYFNFPITILEMLHSRGIRGICDDILSYCCFAFTANEQEEVNNKIIKANQYYGVTFTHYNYDNGKNLFLSIPSNSPKAGITYFMLMDFYNNSKTDFEIDSFIGFCAIRSILQKQKCFKVTKNYVVARMAGFANTGDSARYPARVERYLKRYHFDKLIAELKDHWGLKVYANHTYGLFVSFKMNYRELGVYAELRKKKNKNAGEKVTKKLENEIILQDVKNTLFRPNVSTPYHLINNN
jgi:hypothetical protein